MVVCECVLSDSTLEHIDTIKKALEENSYFTHAELVEILVRYVLCDLDEISTDDLILIDDYFFLSPRISKPDLS